VSLDEDAYWGPRRPPAVSWAGGLLLLLALAQLGAFGAALILDVEALFESRGQRIVTASVLGVLAFQVLAAVGVLRLWRGWRGIAMLLCAVTFALQVVGMLGPLPDPVVVAVNLSLAALYLVVFVLLARSREAFR
jgi:hypothetical protein